MAAGITSFINPKHVVGTDEWAVDNLLFTSNTLREAERDCSLVADNAPYFREYARRHGQEWPAFCKQNLHADAAWVSKIEEGVAVLRGQGHAGPITRAQALSAAETMATAAPQRGHGDAASDQVEKGRKGFKTKTSVSVADRVNSAGGNRADYLAGRIKAKAARGDGAAKAVEAAVLRGEYNDRGMRAAARDAGIVKPANPIKAAARALKKVSATSDTEAISSDLRGAKMVVRGLTREEQAQLLDWLTRELAKP